MLSDDRSIRQLLPRRIGNGEVPVCTASIRVIAINGNIIRNH